MEVVRPCRSCADSYGTLLCDIVPTASKKEDDFLEKVAENIHPQEHSMIAVMLVLVW